MRRLYFLLCCSIVLGSCNDATDPEPSIRYEMGRVTALIDEAPWRSSYFPDSLVGFYDTLTTRLQIIGQEVRGSGRHWPTLLLVIPTGAAPGGYPLTSESSGQIAIWTPAIGATYISAGAPIDSLWIEQLDPAARYVRGSFRFLGSPIQNQRSVYVVGHFEGTLRVTDTL